MLGVLCSRWRTRRFMALRCSNIFISQFLCLMNSLQRGPLKKWFQVTTSHISKVWFLWCTTKFLQIHPLDCESLEFFRFSTKKKHEGDMKNSKELIQTIWHPNRLLEASSPALMACVKISSMASGWNIRWWNHQPAFFPISADLSPLVKPQDIYGCFRK